PRWSGSCRSSRQTRSAYPEPRFAPCLGGRPSRAASLLAPRSTTLHPPRGARQEKGRPFYTHQSTVTHPDDATRLSPDRTVDAPHAQRIGLYRLVRELGHGGMGAVFLAVRDDDAFQKRVAVKILRRGMDTDAIISRFRNERQILAGLDHPNI